MPSKGPCAWEVLRVEPRQQHSLVLTQDFPPTQHLLDGEWGISEWGWGERSVRVWPALLLMEQAVPKIRDMMIWYATRSYGVPAPHCHC